jgi:hypothetical protein
MFGVFFLGALYVLRVLRYDALQIGRQAVVDSR